MTNRFYIAGFKFHGGVIKATKGKLLKDDLVQLKPDPDNPYDENAIEVYHNGDMIGFVPKAINQEVLPNLDNLTAYVSRVDIDAALEEPWKAVQITLESEEAA